MGAPAARRLPLGSPRHGRVVAFDEERGLGAVETDDGEELPFHCVAIADGSRTIVVGACVEFVLGASPVGTFEARAIVPGQGP